MNFEHVSVENHQKPRQSYLPGFEESTIFSPPCPDVDQNRRPIDEVQLRNPETIRILQRLGFLMKWNCAQIVPVTVKYFQTVPNETESWLINLIESAG
jgi:hypothetical protein